MVFNNRGMSIIASLMITLPLTAILVTGISFMYEKDANKELYQRAQTDIDAMASLIVATARHTNLCMTNVAFNGGTYNVAQAQGDAGQALTVQIPGVDNGAYAVPNGAADNADYFMNLYGLRAAEISFQEVEDNGRNRVGDIVLTVRSRPEKQTLLRFAPRVIGRLSIDMDAGNNITQCIAGASPTALCENLGGRYDPTLTPNCRMGYPDVSCPSPDEYITSIDASGNPVCASATVSCDPATEGYLVGFVNGLKVCRQFAGPPPPPPPGIVAGCYIDTPAFDIFTPNSCGYINCYPGAPMPLTQWGDAQVSVGDTLMTDYMTFATPTDYSVSWTGCDSTWGASNNQCQIDSGNGTAVATVTHIPTTTITTHTVTATMTGQFLSTVCP